uniref:CUE domain-containing protein n=1 Tax=Ascaris lumbricoides TaxID=6252 RepID=A0A0M3I6H2_ASCLU
MGDLVRDAFQASGIDEEMEKVIADAILQKWNDEHSADITSFKLNEETNNAQRSGLKTPPITSLQDLDHSGLDCAKVRLLSEQLWRRLERKYEAKLQAWKKSEQKQLDAMLEKLRSEYRESIDAKQAQVCSSFSLPLFLLLCLFPGALNACGVFVSSF